MKDNSRVVKIITDIFPHDQAAFEKLGFNFETQGNQTKIIFPKGWIWAMIDDNGFTMDLIDENGCSHGYICYGNYPRISASMWLYRKPFYDVMKKHNVETILKEELKQD